MSKEQPKFEKIVKKIEEAVPTIQEKEPIEKKELKEKEVLKFSPQEKTEQLWAFWNEYVQKKAKEIIRRRKDLPLEERGRFKKLEKEVEAEELPELSVLKKKIAEYWQDKRVQILFKKHLEENLQEREEIRPDLKNYHQEEKEIEENKKTYEDLLKNLFVQRGQEPNEITQIEIAELSAKIDFLRNHLEEIFQENPELASFVQYEKLKDYHQQFEEGGFIWAPSREKLFAKILEHLVLLNKNRPMLLVGETGTGKTRLVRAAVKRLTNREPFEVGEEAKSDIRPLLGSQSISQEKTFITYGPLGQALTGKKTSLDKESDGGGIFYMDEMNGYPPDALRSLIKQISGRSPGEKVTFAAWRGVWEKIAEKSGLIGAANLASEKHPDRPELPVEITRELTTLEVDYPEQTKENPELYEMMIAALMDKNNRIRLKEGEIEPAWLEKADPLTKEKIKELDLNPQSGGTLWRFANLVGEIQKSYKSQENVLTAVKSEASYLRTAVLDPGIVISWLREYRISVLRKGEPLKDFLQEKLRNWSEQRTYPQEDRGLLKAFFVAYNLPTEEAEKRKTDVKREKIWSEKEIGFLSPRVPRLKEKIEAPKPISRITFLEDGTEIEYQPAESEVIGDKVAVGKTKDGKIVLEDQETKIAQIVEPEKFNEIKKGLYLEKIKQELTNPQIVEQRLLFLIEKGAESIPNTKDKERYFKQAKEQLKRLSTKEKEEQLKTILGIK